jgi:hypothetical protein
VDLGVTDWIFGETHGAAVGFHRSAVGLHQISFDGTFSGEKSEKSEANIQFQMSNLDLKKTTRSLFCWMFVFSFSGARLLFAVGIAW